MTEIILRLNSQQALFSSFKSIHRSLKKISVFETNFRGNRIFSSSVSIFKFFGEDLVVQIAIYNTFDGDIFCWSTLKPQNLVDLIALKSSLRKYQFSSLNFQQLNFLMQHLFNIVQRLRPYNTCMMELSCENS